MTREEIKNTPELVDLMLDKCVLADSRTKVRKRLEEVCDLAIKALEQTTWIPCSERLPEEDTDVLVTLECGLIGIMQKKLAEDDNGEPCYKWVDYEGDDEHEVLAWMPLPERYKKDEYPEMPGQYDNMTGSMNLHP